MFSDAIWWRHNKSNMADGRHIESRILAISPRVIVWLTRYLAYTSRTMTSRDENNNFRKFKMADGRHFENGFITISQLRIIRFQWNLMCRCIVCFQERSIIKVSKFCKFKMADSRFVSDYISAYRSRGCSELIGDVLLFWLLYKDKSAICTH